MEIWGEFRHFLSFPIYFQKLTCTLDDFICMSNRIFDFHIVCRGGFRHANCAGHGKKDISMFFLSPFRCLHLDPCFDRTNTTWIYLPLIFGALLHVLEIHGRIQAGKYGGKIDIFVQILFHSQKISTTLDDYLYVRLNISCWYSTRGRIQGCQLWR
jgi:hypothetical protein